MIWASITVIIVYAVNLGITLARNGEQKDEKYDFGLQLIGTSISLTLLYFAGTFDCLIK